MDPRGVSPTRGRFEAPCVLDDTKPPLTETTQILSGASRAKKAKTSSLSKRKGGKPQDAPSPLEKELMSSEALTDVGKHVFTFNSAEYLQYDVPLPSAPVVKHGAKLNPIQDRMARQLESRTSSNVSAYKQPLANISSDLTNSSGIENSEFRELTMNQQYSRSLSDEVTIDPTLKTLPLQTRLKIHRRGIYDTPHKDPPPRPPMTTNYKPVMEATKQIQGGQELVSHMQTARDALVHFTNKDSKSVIRVIHCVPSTHPGDRDYRPYDLLVIEEKEAKALKEYYTITAKGVSHIIEGAPTEYVTLADWTRESAIFSALRSRSFFRQYIIRKAMDKWKKFIIRQHYEHAEVIISKQLLQMRVIFNPFYREVQTVLSKLIVIEGFDMGNLSHCRTSDDWVMSQKARRQILMTKADECNEQIMVQLNKLFKSLQTKAAPEDDTALIEASTPFQKQKLKGIVAAKIEQLEAQRVMKEGEWELSKLYRFARLVDVVFIQTKVRIVEAATQNLVNAIAPAKQSTGYENNTTGTGMGDITGAANGSGTTTAAGIGNDTTENKGTGKSGRSGIRVGLIKSDLYFTEKKNVPLMKPTPEDIEKTLLHSISELTTTLSSTQRITETQFMDDITEYVKLCPGAEVEAQKLATMSEALSSHDYHRGMIKCIRDVIAQDKQQSREFCNMLVELHPIFLFKKQWNRENYLEAEHNVDDLRSDLEMFTGWKRLIERAPAAQGLGAIHADAQSLRGELLPIALEGRQTIQEAGFKMVDRMINEANESIKTNEKLLQDKPLDLDRFVAFYKYIVNLAKERQDISQRITAADEIIKLFESNNIKVPVIKKTQVEMSLESQERLANSIGLAEAYVEEHISEQLATTKTKLEAVVKELVETLATLNDGIIVDASADPQAALGRLADIGETVESAKSDFERLSEYQEIFTGDKPNQSPLQQAENQLQFRKTMWTSIKQWNEFENSVLHSNWKEANAEDAVKVIQDNVKESIRYLKREQTGSLDSSGNPAPGPAMKLLKNFRKSTDEMRGRIPIIQDLGNPALQKSHWEKILKLLNNQSLSPDAFFSLNHLLEAGIMDKKNEVAEISSVASGEYSLLLTLRKISASMQAYNFTVKEYARGGGKASQTPRQKEDKNQSGGIPEEQLADYYILTSVEDIIQALEDNQVALGTMMGSRFVIGIRTQVETWAKRLAILSDLMDEWTQCQVTWMYLEVIFGQPDIQRQLPTEHASFEGVNTFWKSFMRKVAMAPQILKVAKQTNLVAFQERNKELDLIQKKLEEYLETKRMAFPRFFFLSNDELLQILSRTTNARAVQPHLRKIFENVNRIGFESDEPTKDHETSGQAPGVEIVCSMFSCESEEVKFTGGTVLAEGPVEFWLRKVELAMQRTVKDAFRASYEARANGTERRDWLFAWPAQAVLNTECILFASETEIVLESVAADKDIMQRLMGDTIEGIEELVTLTEGSLSKIQRTLIGTLIVLSVHNREIVTQISGPGPDQCSSMNDFGWEKQLRYYWDHAHDECYVRQSGNSFVPGYEYYGVPSRLVITPLTDRCYITLTSALALHLGGSPQGPAGTGKTETTKDLAKALAIQCVVFNCSEGIDYVMTGRFFSGLVQCGAWSCFDEFNRIDIEVLSVIAQQILTIQRAIMSESKTFTFEGRNLTLDPHIGIFITMNPGYAGRTELPDNLKALFRPICMLIPDYALIAEIMLFSEGFRTAKVLARKMTRLYRLSSEQLSQQDHYDFGMRALKSVLVMAGALRRQHKDQDENVVLIRAMRDSNVPKFLSEDVPLFMGIVRDLFPGVKIPDLSHGVLETEIIKELKARDLVPLQSFVLKILQFFDTHIVRHGVMLVGEGGTGKTTIRSVLAKAMTSISKDSLLRRESPDFVPVIIDELNPKSVTMGELYGEFNLTTHEWADGLVASLSRKVTEAANPSSSEQNDGGVPAHLTKRWLVFDGPVDALWIENMNTVLDDNKMLCLANSERIRLPSTVSLIFEVADLAVASPATVSRCGMVYISQDDLGWEPLIDTWVKRTLSPILRRLILAEDYGISYEEKQEKMEMAIQKWKTLEMKKRNEQEKQERKQMERDQRRQKREEERLNNPEHNSMMESIDKDESSEAEDEEAGTGDESDSLSIDLEDPTLQPTPEDVPELDSFNRWTELLAKIVANVTSKLNQSIKTIICKVLELDYKVDLPVLRQQKVAAFLAYFEGLLEDRFRFVVRKILMARKRGTGQQDEATLMSQASILEDATPMTMRSISQRIIYAIAWAFGGCGEDRKTFSRVLLSSINEAVPDWIDGLPTELRGKTEGESKSTVFDFVIDDAQRMFVHWDALVPEFEFSRAIQQCSGVADLLVDTADTVSLMHNASLLLRYGKCTLVVGPTGSGKTALVRRLLKGQSFISFKRDDYELPVQAPGMDAPIGIVSVPFSFSARTSAMSTQQLIEDKLEKKRKTLLAPPAGRQMVFFIDDVNMPQPETYFAQPPIELLRQCIAQGGFYDRKKLFFKHVEGISFVAACCPPSGGRSQMTKRFTRHFAQLACPELPDASMQKVFGNILSGFITSIPNGQFSQPVRDLVPALITATISLYNKIRDELRPTPVKSHYTFNMRAVSSVTLGLLDITPNVVKDPGDFLRSWVHEMCRTFRDRLCTEEDMRWFDDNIANIIDTSSPIQSAVSDLVVQDYSKVAFDTSDTQLLPPHMLQHSSSNHKSTTSIAPLFIGRGGPASLLFGKWCKTQDEERVVSQLDPSAPHEEREAVIAFRDLTHEPRRYTEALDQVNEDMLANSTGTSGSQRLVFFNDAVHHFSRIFHAITRPRGNVLLVGPGGSGRQSLARIATHVAEYELFQIEVSKGYRLAEFHADIKTCLMKCVLDAPVVFLLTDSQIVDDAFLESLNSLLTSGEIPNLWEPDEFEALVSKTRPICKKLGLSEDRDGVYEYFVGRCRDRFHLCLCFSPLSEAFRIRCRQFPALINCMTLDWFFKWPAEALRSVAERFLRSSGFDDESPRGTNSFSSALAGVCVAIHTSVERCSVKFYEEAKRHNHTTPTSYLQLLQQYKTLFSNGKDTLGSRIGTFKSGLTKLDNTSRQVQEMQVELEKLQPILNDKVEATNALLDRLKVDQEEAEKVRKIVNQEKDSVAVLANKAQQIKDDAQSDLDKVMPEYYSAIKSLKSLNKNDITEMKSFANPPTLVVTVMEAVCIMKGVKPTWDESKKLLSDIHFLQSLEEYDRDSIPQRILKQIKVYIDNPKFNPHDVEQVSKAAKSLCLWVRAMYLYAMVSAVVEPKREKLKEAEAELKVQEDRLKEKLDALAEVEGKLATLQSEYDTSINEKCSLQRRISDIRVKLTRAEKLIAGLGGEGTRWKETKTNLEQQLSTLTGDMLVAAGYIAYLGAFTESYRIEMVREWVATCLEKGVPINTKEDDQGNLMFSLKDLLATPKMLRQFARDALPPDNLSLNNALIVTFATRFPLIIDPQQQAIRWILRKERSAGSGVKVTTPNDPSYVRTLENCVRIGIPLVVDNIGEDIDPTLDCVLRKDVRKVQGRLVIKLGDNEVDYNPEFRLYLVSRLATPHYSPEVSIRTAIVDFSVSAVGLEEQLLAVVVAHERPDLEERREALTSTIASDAQHLEEAQQKILALLAGSEGNILDDETLIDALEASRITQADVGTRLQEGIKTAKEIDITRNVYRSIAVRGGIVYATISGLSRAERMYAYSLEAYLGIFKLCLSRKEQGADPALLEKRIKFLIHTVTIVAYRSVSRGLMARHKEVFGFMLASNVERHLKIVTPALWSALIRGKGMSAVSSPQSTQPLDVPWLSNDQSALNALLFVAESLERIQMGTLVPDLSSDMSSRPLMKKDTFLTLLKAQEGEWRRWIAHSECEMVDTPLESWFQSNQNMPLPAFIRVLIVRILRPERLVYALPIYTKKTLGVDFVPPPFNIEDTYNDSSAKSPIIFILGRGGDPIKSIFTLAESKKAVEVSTISLGQGQGTKAEALIRSTIGTSKRDENQAEGKVHWVVLQNCHLAVSWMPRLEAIVETMQAGDESGTQNEDPNALPPISPTFRLFLTSAPTQQFPSSVLASGIKVTDETRGGMHEGLRGAYDGAKVAYNSKGTNPAQRALFYRLALFHTCVLERRRFGSIGFSCEYDFSITDLQVAVEYARQMDEEQRRHPVSRPGPSVDSLPLQPLEYMVGVIAYCGRVTDLLDQRTVDAMLRRFTRAQSVLQKLVAETGFSDTSGDSKDSTEEEIDTFASDQQFALKALPERDTPETFGLHENANVACFMGESNNALESIMAIRPVELVNTSVSSSGGAKGESTQMSDPIIQRVSDLIAHLPDVKVLTETKLATTNSGKGISDPLRVFLRQEAERYSHLVLSLSTSLNTLKSALLGLVTFGAILEEVHKDIIVEKVPGRWVSLALGGFSFPTNKGLQGYIDDVGRRVKYIEEWVLEASQCTSELLPERPHWAGSFFFPHGFFTAVLQRHARIYNVAVDELVFETHVLTEPVSKSASKEEFADEMEPGITMYGLFAEGFRWDDKLQRVTEQKKGVLIEKLPYLRMVPIGEKDANVTFSNTPLLNVPVYTTLERRGVLSTTGQSTNYVLDIQLPIDVTHETIEKSLDHWILRGAAAFIQDNN